MVSSWLASNSARNRATSAANLALCAFSWPNASISRPTPSSSLLPSSITLEATPAVY